VARVEEHARRSHINLDRATLSLVQLEQKLEGTEKHLKKEKLLVCVLLLSYTFFLHFSQRLDALKALRRLHIHKQTYQAFFDLAGANDIPGLHRIIKNSKHGGWSAEKLLDKTRKALNGTYHPKNFSDVEFDLATAIYELGGGAALYALQKSPFAFLSRTTLISRRQDFKLCITVGSVKMSDIMKNIETMFKDVKPGHRKAGMTLMMDEVACDGRLCYLADTDEIAGLCEHAGTELPSVKMGKNLDILRAVQRAICDGKVHIAQEVFVAAISRNDDSDYGAKPVLLIPTCKKGSYRDSACVMEMVKQAWKLSPYGEGLHGSFWSIASDGDPKRRPALFQHCMQLELKEGDKLFEYVGQLPGCNLWTGPSGETQDLDVKHDMKRK
jgi:hypothetical protein